MAITVTTAGSAGWAVPSTGLQPPAGLSLAVPVTNTVGDWMVALIVWRQPAGAPGGVTVSVEDDAHNWWEPLGAPTGDSSASGTVRAALWAAPAARAATQVMIAPTGLLTALAATVLDVAGMAKWMTLSPAGPVTGFANAATALTTSLGAPSAQAIILALLGSDLNTATITGPGAGWTALTPVTASNGVDHTADLQLSAAWQTATGATSAVWSSSATLDLAGVTAGLLVTAAAPAQPNPNWPVIITECAPGAGVQTPPSQLTWQNLSGRQLAFSITQGAPYLLGGLQAGQGTMTLDDPDGALIPPGSGAFAGIDSGTPVRVRAIWPASATPHNVIYNGFFQQLPPSWDALERGVTVATITDVYGYANRQLPAVLRAEILDDSPAAWWPLDGAAGSTLAVNMAPGSALPPVTAAPWGTGPGAATYAFGASSGAIKGDSSSSMFSETGVPSTGLAGWTLLATSSGFPAIPADNGALPVTTGLTIEGWFSLPAVPAPSAGACLWAIWNPTHSDILRGEVDSAGDLSVGNNAAGIALPSPLTFPTGMFHLAAVFNRGRCFMYYNGALVGSFSFVGTPPASWSRFSAFGGQPVGGVPPFNGFAAHIALYSYPLSAARIASHYQAGAAAFAGESASWRIERILSYAGLTGRRAILPETGVDVTPMASMASLSGQTIAATLTGAPVVTGTPAASALQSTAASTVPAVLTVTPTGALFCLGRQYAYSQPVKWVIGERGDLGEIPYLPDVAYGYDPARVVNDIQITQADTSVVTIPTLAALETGSGAQYGDQSYQATGYCQNDATSAYGAGPGAVDLANWIASENAAPHLRPAQVTIDAASHPAAWPLVLAVAASDMATVNRRPPTGAYTLPVTGRISQMTRKLVFAEGGQVTGSVVLALDYAPEQGILTADDSVLGLLNGKNPLGW